MPKGSALVLLDERGPSATSEELAADIGRARNFSRPAYAVAIGGPDGLHSSLGAVAHRIISFGQMTWPHQLVRVMAGGAALSGDDDFRRTPLSSPMSAAIMARFDDPCS